MFFTPATRHCAPSAAEPGAVIRSTTCDGGIEGGMIGAGRAAACATEIDATANTTKTRAAPAASLARFVMRIFGFLLFPTSFEEQTRLFVPNARERFASSASLPSPT